MSKVIRHMNERRQFSLQYQFFVVTAYAVVFALLRNNPEPGVADGLFLGFVTICLLGQAYSNGSRWEHDRANGAQGIEPGVEMRD